MGKLSISQINKNLPPKSRFTVLQFADPHYSPCGKMANRVLCKCSCGNFSLLIVSNLQNTFSCGCLSTELLIQRSTKYSQRIKYLYASWQNMVKRCYDENCWAYKYYGAKGVIVCAEWRNNYQNFLDWSLANGYEEGLEIDKDIRGNGFLYSPDTCCWVTSIENGRNKSNTVRYDYKGERLTLMEISERYHIPIHVLNYRIYRCNLNIIDAITKPFRKNKNKNYGTNNITAAH